MKTKLLYIAISFLLIDGIYSQTAWNLEPSGTTYYINDVFFPVQNHGWVVGESGTILKTTNGGDNWIPQSSGTTNDLKSVFFIYPSGWAVGEGGTILKTTNAGINWIPQSSGTTQDLRSVYFDDHYNGTVVGNSGIILNTTNGGTNWTPQISGSLISLLSVILRM